jgi:flagellar motility protein MotE (MotC chaperone)
MTKLRLIPVVIFAAAALLVIKGMSVISPERIMMRPATIAAAPAPQAASVPDTDLEFTSAMPAKKEEPPKKEEPAAPSAAPQAPQTPHGINVGVPGDQSPAQRALLERLQQRRQELDTKARDLELRENLIREAEQRLEARMNELRALENPNADAGPDSPRMKNVVAMYEGMKPKDAARILDKLEMPVLVDIARAMKPAKLSEVLAVMNVEIAHRLTVELTRGGTPDKATPPSDLPRVNMTPQQPPAPAPAKQTQQKQAPQR